MLLGDDDPAYARWSTYRNRVLAQALTLHEAEIHTCGQPASESFDPDGPRYSAEDSHCRACAVLSQAGSEHDKPGTIWHLDVKRR